MRLSVLVGVEYVDGGIAEKSAGVVDLDWSTIQGEWNLNLNYRYLDYVNSPLEEEAITLGAIFGQGRNRTMNIFGEYQFRESVSRKTFRISIPSYF